MRQGTNANTKANREAAKVIAKSSGKEYAQKIRDKYETDKDMSRRRGKDQPSYADVKAGIDAKNPTYLSPIKTMGKDGEMKNRPLPFPTRKSSYKSPVDKVLDDIRNVKQAGPEKQKEVEDKLRNIPDDPRIRIGKTSFSNMMQNVEKAQQKSTVAATGGLLAKTFNPALAGVEAMQRYKTGDKKGALLSTVQAIGGPIGFGAGVINALRTRRTAAQAAVDGDGGDKKKPQLLRRQVVVMVVEWVILYRVLELIKLQKMLVKPLKV